VRPTILLLAAAMVPAPAAQTSITVEQFEQSLPALHALRDAAAARKLASLVLTERASPGRAAHWQTTLRGKRTEEALTALVDASSFLDPPADEIPSRAAPDVDTQKQILSRAVDTLVKTIHKLPDFYAVRTTTHFETATPQQLWDQEQMIALSGSKAGELPHHELGPVDETAPKRTRLYFIEAREQTVTYREGSEVTTASRGAGGSPDPFLGLETKGEFGPILHMVLVDALQRGLTWSHWERGANGPLAVFRYKVAKEFSHYEIENQSGKAPDYPAYNGELTIDPESGAILRITVQASVRGQEGATVDSNVLVEYGPVDIGGRTYTCPVHGVAITRTEDLYASQPAFLNDITFTGYHLFRAELRILP
jgi:hypothetical protein